MTHYSDAGVATGSSSLFDAHGPIGIGVTTAVANFNFDADRKYDGPPTPG